jgi:hypothetical protein
MTAEGCVCSRLARFGREARCDEKSSWMQIAGCATAETRSAGANACVQEAAGKGDRGARRRFELELELTSWAVGVAAAGSGRQQLQVQVQVQVAGRQRQAERADAGQSIG